MVSEKQVGTVEDVDDLLADLSEEEINEFCEANEPEPDYYCPHTVHDMAWQNGINH